MFILNFLKSLKTRKRNAVHPTSETVFLWEGDATEKYHWWPMKHQPTSSSLDNNLYATGGGLDKYDHLFSATSVEYQKKTHYRSLDSKEEDANWAGFCDAATILSCTRTYPKHDVMVYYNNNNIKFTKRDIESLMIIASYNTINKSKSLFCGERYNGSFGEDKLEPYPKDLFEILKKVCEDATPFALDISHGTAVWNYAYNKVLVKTTHIPPEKYMNKINKLVTKTGNIYYNFIIESNAYPEKNIDIWGWFNNSLGFKKHGWLSDKHPDFAWKKYPQMEPWTGVCLINPEISASNIFEIYNCSLTNIKEVYL